MIDCTGGAWMRLAALTEMHAAHADEHEVDGGSLLGGLDAPDYLPVGSTTAYARNDAPSRE
jgi:hypothetical protein